MTPEEIADRAVGALALQRRDELRRLVKIVDDRKPSIVVEIGTYQGGTLSAWCECAADDALIVSIDLPGGDFGGGYSEHRQPEMEAYARCDQELVFLRGDSHSAEIQKELALLLAGRLIDFLFIDGDHTYEGVSDDFWTYSRAVRPGGLIVLHDIVRFREEPRCKVYRFWKEIREQFAGMAIRTKGDFPGCGIGVIEWAGR